MYTQLNSSRLGDPGTPITVTARWSPFVVIDDTASSRPSATHGQPSCLPGGLAVAPPPPGTTLGLRHPKWVPRAESPKGARGGGSCLCLPPPPRRRARCWAGSSGPAARASSPRAERGRRAPRSGARPGRGLPPGPWGPTGGGGAERLGPGSPRAEAVNKAWSGR